MHPTQHTTIPRRASAPLNPARLASLASLGTWLHKLCVHDVTLMDLQLMLAAVQQPGLTIDCGVFGAVTRKDPRTASGCFSAWLDRITDKGEWLFKVTRPGRGRNGDGITSATLTPGGLRLLGL